MFYSQEYLARKGPLGTVWSAAHLQNRLKKSHYTATNIPETVGSSLLCFLNPKKLPPLIKLCFLPSALVKSFDFYRKKKLSFLQIL